MVSAAMDDLQFCSNYDCPYRLEHGRPAEYSAAAERCSDCGAALHSAITPTVKEAEDAKLGAPLGEPVEFRPSPLGLIVPALCMAGGALIFIVAGFRGLIGWFAASLVAGGAGLLRHRRQSAPRILRYQHGFVIVRDAYRLAISAARVEDAQVTARDLRVAGLKLGTLHDLTLTVGERKYLLTSFSRGGEAPFADFARTLAARSSLR
jgi:hypothetical protein